jgi:hypothetical protein
VARTGHRRKIPLLLVRCRRQITPTLHSDETVDVLAASESLAKEPPSAW